MQMCILPVNAGLRNISFDIKTKTALEGKEICVLGMPGPVGTGFGHRLGLEVPGAKWLRPHYGENFRNQCALLQYEKIF